jgi:hypothetical protein
MKIMVAFWGLSHPPILGLLRCVGKLVDTDTAARLCELLSPFDIAELLYVEL